MRVFPPCDLFYNQGLVRKTEGIDLPEREAKRLVTEGWSPETRDTTGEILQDMFSSESEVSDDD